MKEKNMNYSFLFLYNKIMNQILFYKDRINKFLKKFYMKILIGIFILIILILMFLIKEENKEKIYEISSRIINTNIKINEIYDNVNRDNKESFNDKYFGRIIIDKINIDYIIFNTFSDELMKLSICKLHEDNGNISLIGHNYDNNRFFSNINELEINDEIRIIQNDNEYVYKVYKIYEVYEDDLNPLNGKEINEITLITCNNFNKKRYIIKASLYN